MRGERDPSSHVVEWRSDRGNEEPPGLVDEHCRVSALDELEIGDVLDTLDGPHEVVAIDSVTCPQPVYNIEVASEHVYRIGQSGVLVHNVSDDCPLVQITTAPKGTIAFAQGTAVDAVRNIGRIDHAGRHLSDFGVIAGNQGTNAFRDAVKSNAIRILENPLRTFDHVIASQQVKGFYGMIDGKKVVFFIAKEPRGKIGIGELVTAVVPSPQQIINWGI